jgi:hypothetical protein
VCRRTGNGAVAGLRPREESAVVNTRAIPSTYQPASGREQTPIFHPFGLAQDRPFGLAQDTPFGLAQDRPFGLAQDRLPSSIVPGGAAGMGAARV